MNTVVECFDYYKEFATSELHPVRNKVWLLLVLIPWFTGTFAGRCFGHAIPMWLRLYIFLFIPSGLILHSVRALDSSLDEFFTKKVWRAFLVFFVISCIHTLLMNMDFDTSSEPLSAPRGWVIAKYVLYSITIILFVINTLLLFRTNEVLFGFQITGLRLLYLLLIPFYLYAVLAYALVCMYGSTEENEKRLRMKRLYEASRNAPTEQERREAKESLSYYQHLMDEEIRKAKEEEEWREIKEAEEKRERYIQSALAGGRAYDFDSDAYEYNDGHFESSGHSYRTYDDGFTWTDERGKRFDRDGDPIDD